MKPTPLDHEKRGEDVPIGVVCSKNCGERFPTVWKISIFCRFTTGFVTGGFVSFCPDELTFMNTKWTETSSHESLRKIENFQTVGNTLPTIFAHMALLDACSPRFSWSNSLGNIFFCLVKSWGLLCFIYCTEQDYVMSPVFPKILGGCQH